MGLLSSIAKFALPAVGGLIAGPAGLALGSFGQSMTNAVTSGIAGQIDANNTAKSASQNWAQQSQAQDSFNNFSAEQAQKQMDFQTAANQKQMDYELQSVINQMQHQTGERREAQAYATEMSNTAHQREIADLAKAGLNPILAAKYGGSSTPTSSATSGASAHGSTSSGAQPAHLQTPSQTASSASQIRQNVLQESKLNAEIDLLRAEAQTKRASVGLTNAQTTELSHRQTERIDQGIAKLYAETGRTSSEQLKNNFEAEIMRTITLPKGGIDIATARATLEELEMKMKILRSPDGYKFITQQLGQRGGALAAGRETVVNIINDTSTWLRDIIEKKLPFPYGAK